MVSFRKRETRAAPRRRQGGELRLVLRALGFLLALLPGLAGVSLAEDWPTHRRDLQRSGVSPEQLQLPLTQTWAYRSANPPAPAWTGPAKKNYYATNQVLLKSRLAFDRAFHVAVAGDGLYFGSSVDDTVYRLNPAAIAAYPMYRGLATVVGMKVILTGKTFADEVETLRENFDAHDFFFIHYKPADAAGEDGDFDAKVRRLEELDAFIPQIRELEPDVLMVCGDHATPAIMAGHSWHPVPFMLHSALTRGEGIKAFNEKDCALGSIGRIPATNVMLMALSHAGKLAKFGP